MRVASQRDLTLINAAGFLRSFGVGLMGVILGLPVSRRAVVLRNGRGHCGWARRIGSGYSLGKSDSRPGRTVDFLSGFLAAERRGWNRLAVSPSLPLLAMLAFVGMLNATAGNIAGVNRVGRMLAEPPQREEPRGKARESRSNSETARFAITIYKKSTTC